MRQNMLENARAFSKERCVAGLFSTEHLKQVLLWRKPKEYELLLKMHLT
jgi:hypothetical protein